MTNPKATTMAGPQLEINTNLPSKDALEAEDNLRKERLNRANLGNAHPTTGDATRSTAASAGNNNDFDCLSPLSTKTMDSQREFYMPHQTVLIFDWDDTLCPSTYCRTELKDDLICKIWKETLNDERNQAEKAARKREEEAARESMPETTAEKLERGTMDQGMDQDGNSSSSSSSAMIQERELESGGFNLHNPDESLLEKCVDARNRAQLGEICEGLIELIQGAKRLGKVVIVTNAETGWIELSCRAWLPRAYKEVMSCQLVSARSRYEPEGVSSPAGWKARAFHEVVDVFYSHRSWKNIISIGDAPHEREAIFRITADNAHPQCRTKSIKLMVKPTTQELITQIGILSLHLEKIVQLDNGLDLEFDKSQGTFC